MTGKKLLVFSAHAGDYVWRAGGTIAKYVMHGADVKVICLSMGVRGESEDLWKSGETDAEKIKTIRREESGKAAEILGVSDIEFWDLGDYPMHIDEKGEEQLLRTIREFGPDFIITHDVYDVMNPDHDLVHKKVHEATVQACRHGVVLEGTKAVKQMRIYGFEPHQPEMCRFTPSLFVDITETMEKKVAAMNCFQAQRYMIQLYTERANLRGNHARRVSGNNLYRYAEAFSSLYPFAVDELI